MPDPQDFDGEMGDTFSHEGGIWDRSCLLYTSRAEGAREPAGRSSEKERREDAKALIADEGRDKLRKAMAVR